MDDKNLLEFHFDDSVCPARERIRTIIASRDKETNKAYDAWAHYFDEDMITLGYGGYEAMGKNVTKFVPDKNAKILDLGCGTGLFGRELRSLGYLNTYGVDASDSFLEESRKKEVYVELQKHRFGVGIKAPYNDSSFEVVMAISVFGPNTVNHSALHDVSRIIKPGGYLMIFIRRSRLEMERENFNVKAVLNEWVTSGQWERLQDGSAVYYSRPDGVEEGDEVVEQDGVIVTLRKFQP